MDLEHRIVDNAGVRLHAVCAGSGPVVLLLHGFPGLSYSWRHQLRSLSEAGYRAVALDQRGYGRSDRSPGTASYSSAVVEADLLAVLDDQGADDAVVVGQDFGSAYAWNLAQRHPERVRAVAGTVPWVPDTTRDEPPSVRFARVAEQHFLHLHYFQAEGVAERDLGGEALPEFLRRLFWALSGSGDLLSVFGHPSAGTSYLEALPPAPDLPWPWLGADDFATYVEEYRRAGAGLELAGGLGSYRSYDADWARALEWLDVPIRQPSLLVMGESDPVRHFVPPRELDRMRERMPGLVDIATVPGAGHFVQQEQPAAFDDVLLGFLAAGG
ncbi:alpha/beta fold hydrolase [Nocardioides pacificus]